MTLQHMRLEPAGEARLEPTRAFKRVGNTVEEPPEEDDCAYCCECQVVHDHEHFFLSKSNTMTLMYKHQFAFNELTELLRINKKIVREKIHGAVYGLIHLLINIFPHACM